MDCAEAQTNLYVLAPPTQCAHNNPAVLGEIIKRRGLLPLINQSSDDKNSLENFQFVYPL